jgi:predicted AlkP superfamily pyrophosphatase or phosphodiesterase
VIISLDGCTPELFQDEYATNLRWLSDNGSYSWQAQTVNPSITLVAHASMLTGLLPAKHHIDWNDYKPDKGAIEVPTVFDLAQKAGLQTAFIASKRKFWHLDKPGVANASAYPRSQREETGIDPKNPAADPSPEFDTVKAVRRCFGLAEPNLCFIHFAQPDATGHKFGWESDEARYAIRQVDQQIGTLLAMWRKSGFLDHTVIIVTADHGGHEKTHGTDKPQDMTIPWVAWGRNIKKNHEIQSPIRITDTAATAEFILKLAIPKNSDGEVVTEIFR